VVNRKELVLRQTLNINHLSVFLFPLSVLSPSWQHLKSECSGLPCADCSRFPEEGFKMENVLKRKINLDVLEAKRKEQALKKREQVGSHCTPNSHTREPNSSK
jgi:hypothetical protein